VNVAEPEQGVGLIAGPDVRHRIDVANNLHATAQALHFQCAGRVGQRRAHTPEDEGGHHQDDDDEAEDDTPEPPAPGS